MARLVQPRDVGPRAVTLAELRGVLLPLCAGWSWAEGAILDLWRLGAPTPDSGPGVPVEEVEDGALVARSKVVEFQHLGIDQQAQPLELVGGLGRQP